MNIESKLSRLFDYQKFEGNKELEAVINSTKDSVRELAEDELDMVSAAGTGEPRLVDIEAGAEKKVR